MENEKKTSNQSLREQWKKLSPLEKKIANFLALHLSALSTPQFASLLEVENQKVEKALRRLMKKKWILLNPDLSGELSFYQLSNEDLVQGVRQHLSEVAKKKIHTTIFVYLNSLEDPENQAFALAYHAGGAALKSEAYHWNLHCGDFFYQKDDFSMALQYFLQAETFLAKLRSDPEIDFKQHSIDLVLKMTQCYLYTKNYLASLETLDHFLDKHRSLTKPEILELQFRRVQFLTLLSRFEEADEIYQKLLLKKDPKNREFLQSWALVLIERGRYEKALEAFQLIKKEFAHEQDAFTQSMLEISLCQVYSYLGMKSEANASLTRVKELLGDEALVSMSPYFELLRGKFLCIDAQFSEALQAFSLAANGFESFQDSYGKVETLLAMSVPLIENQLIYQASQILQLISEWQELGAYPTLQLTLRLRRMVLAAFSGDWVEEDIESVLQEAKGMGRREDWLKFWFHLALAAQKNKHNDLFKGFLKNTQRVVDAIESELSEKIKACFRTRPDIARFYRLLDFEKPRVELKITAKKIKPQGETPAEEASLAPPRKR